MRGMMKYEKDGIWGWFDSLMRSRAGRGDEHMTMRRTLLSLTLAVAGLLAAPGPVQAFGKAHAEIKGRDGREHGRARITETIVGILIHLKLRGLSAGAHGFHIHEFGKCEGDFESAGGILNPQGAKHGYLNDEGPMAGDLPNLFVNANGEVEIEIMSSFVTLNKDSEDTLFDGNGAALVIHERPDDYRSDPIGNSGPRIACGVIVPGK